MARNNDRCAIGRKRHRITIQEKPESIGRDAVGAESFTWSNLSTAPTVWAEELPVTGREYLAAGQEQGSAVTKFRIRYRSDLDIAMRITYGSRIFDILHIENVEGLDRELVILCKEAVP